MYDLIEKYSPRRELLSFKRKHLSTAVLIAVLTIAMAAGIFGATMGMWLPRMF